VLSQIDGLEKELQRFKHEYDELDHQIIEVCAPLLLSSCSLPSATEPPRLSWATIGPGGLARGVARQSGGTGATFDMLYSKKRSRRRFELCIALPVKRFSSVCSPCARVLLSLGKVAPTSECDLVGTDRAKRT